MNEEKRTIIDLLNLGLAIGAFALFGAIAKELVRWDTGRHWFHRLGSAMVSIYAAWMVGFMVADWYPGKLGVLILACGGASWAGQEIIDVIVRWLARWFDKIVGEKLQ